MMMITNQTPDFTEDDSKTYTRSLPKFQKSKTKKKCKITCVVIQAGPYWSKIHARLNEMTSVFGNKK